MSKQDKILDLTGASTIASWMLAVCQAIDSYGVKSSQLLSKIQLDDFSNIDPNERIPVSKMQVLWQQAVELTGDDAIGLKVAQFVNPTTFNALGFSLWTSESLLDAWGRVFQFYDIISDVLEVKIEQGSTMSALCFNKIEDKEFAPEAIDAFIATAVKLATEVTQGKILPAKVELSRPPHQNSPTIEAFFDCPVAYNQKTNKLYYHNEDLNRPFASANPVLAKHNDEIVQATIDKFKTESYSTKVSQLILMFLKDGEPNKEQIASQLAMSGRSLQRKLEAEGTTFSHLLKNVRMKLAVKYLADDTNSLLQISEMLGFSDPSNFSRAFKLWFEQTPLQFKKHLKD